jgi:hypothetical protein
VKASAKVTEALSVKLSSSFPNYHGAVMQPHFAVADVSSVASELELTTFDSMRFINVAAAMPNLIGHHQPLLWLLY